MSEPRCETCRFVRESIDYDQDGGKWTELACTCETSPFYHADSVCPDDSCGEWQPRHDANEKPGER